MIKLFKQEAPEVLINNKEEWTNILLSLVTQHGSYSNIPKVDKEQVLKPYKHKEIKEALFSTSNKKCCFCECYPTEGGGNIEVEHFKPKSIYYNETFEWSNLMPICRSCNGSKLDHDTIKEPLINPYLDDPIDYFYFKNLRIRPLDNCIDYDKALRTREVCNLNSKELRDARSNLYNQFAEYEETLEDYIKEYYECDTPRKKQNKINKLKNSFKTIDDLSNEKAKFSAYFKQLVDDSDIYPRAKDLIKTHNEMVNEDV